MLPTASVLETVQGVFGAGTRISGSVPVSGGDINQAYRLNLSNGEQVFVKANTLANRDFFTAEVRGLAALRAAGAIGVPAVLGYGADARRGESFLVLEYLAPGPRIPAYWETFGHELAALHRAPCSSYVNQGRYGFEADNYIGAAPQQNTPKQSWVEFYRDCRLLPQLTRAERYLGPQHRRQARWLLDHLDRYLREPDFPSLLHGDLWSGNQLCGPDGKGWIIDPAAYVGDFETDLAMTQLFGRLPEACYRAYHESNPVDWKGFQDRRDLYHLYHLLNHLNLFGLGYLSSVTAILKRFAGN